MPNEPTEEFSPEIRAAFDDYPFPVADADFDARFWRELDTRQSRYRGFGGLLRRLIEVEIEGIAVWRLGVALFGGAAVCGLGVALLSLSSSPITPTQSAPVIAELDRVPTALPRYAREMDALITRPQAATEPRSSTKKEVSSCDSSAKGWV